MSRTLREAQRHGGRARPDARGDRRRGARASSPSSATTARRSARSPAPPASTRRSSSTSSARRSALPRGDEAAARGRRGDRASGGRAAGEVGRRLAEVVVGVLENPRSRPIVLGRIRSASSHPEAAELVRETVTRDIGAARGGARRRPARDARRPRRLAGRRHGARPLRRPRRAARVDAGGGGVDQLAPTFQHYLVGTLRESERVSRST